MFIFIGGVLYSLDPPNEYLWGGHDSPDPPGNRRAWSLASSIPILGLESVCPRKGCPWPWPWPRALCPRLHL